MPRIIEYFLSMASPWAYLGHGTFMEIAGRHQASVRFRPLPVRRLFPETGGLPLPKRHPARQRYRLVELQRWRERRAVPLKLHPRYTPFDPALADRFVIAVVAAGGDPDPFVRAAARALWSEDRDLADPGVIMEIAAACGLQPGLLDQAQGRATEALYDENLQAALAAGVFGVPCYVLDGELFWGQDRLELLEEALASGRAPYRPDEEI